MSVNALHTTPPIPSPTLTPPPIEVGAMVYLKDEGREQWQWHLVVETKIVRGSKLICVDGADIFFNENLVSLVAYFTGGGVL